jgi:hypothetical protein
VCIHIPRKGFLFLYTPDVKDHSEKNFFIKKIFNNYEAVANPPFLQLLDVVKPLGSRVQLFEKVDLQQPLHKSSN